MERSESWGAADEDRGVSETSCSMIAQKLGVAAGIFACRRAGHPARRRWRVVRKGAFDLAPAPGGKMPPSTAARMAAATPLLPTVDTYQWGEGEDRHLLHGYIRMRLVGMAAALILVETIFIFICPHQTPRV